MLLINVKTYPPGTGIKALELARSIEQIATETGVPMGIAVQALDVYRIASQVSIPVYCQHAEEMDPGPYTGSILPEAIKEAGAKGVLLNHAEHRMGITPLKQTIERCKKLGLVTVVCSNNMENTKDIIAMHPQMIAFEDSSLIGSGKAISIQKPEILKEFVGLVANQATPLCGAGISTGDDVKAALDLGTKGVLPSSAILTAENPPDIVREMAHAMK